MQINGINSYNRNNASFGQLGVVSFSPDIANKTNRMVGYAIRQITTKINKASPNTIVDIHVKPDINPANPLFRVTSKSTEASRPVVGLKDLFKKVLGMELQPSEFDEVNIAVKGPKTLTQRIADIQTELMVLVRENEKNLAKKLKEKH